MEAHMIGSTTLSRHQCAAITLGSIVLATMLRDVIHIVFNEQITYATFYPAVMLTALSCGVAWGLTATALSAVASTIWLTPVGRLTIEEWTDFTGMALFLIVCLLIVWLAERVHQHNDELARAAEQLHESFMREQEARKVAEDANRAKDDFLALVTHELRTPLNSIFGWTQLLQRDALDDNERQLAMESIERSVRAQTQLINDLLDFSRIRTGSVPLDMQPLCASEVARSAIQTLLPTASTKGVRLLGPPARLGGPILADADRLQQVVCNLLTNAIKFTPSGGTVSASIQEDHESVHISVADTGEGIDAQFLPKIFDRFTQLKSGRRKGGLGLGLAIVREIIDLHGGSVCAESDGPGHGTKLTVSLPKLRVPSVALPKCALATDACVIPTRALAGKRVLIIDDDDDSTVLVEHVLREFGAETTSAHSAQEAGPLLNAHRPHVVISDLAMPGGDGFELIESLRRNESQPNLIPAISLSAFASEPDRERSLASGFQTHLGKPVGPQQLVEAVAELAGVH
jgi:signal transduction histidine kinase/CheY-like chemotaxis protein